MEEEMYVPAAPLVHSTINQARLALKAANRAAILLAEKNLKDAETKIFAERARVAPTEGLAKLVDKSLQKHVRQLLTALRKRREACATAKKDGLYQSDPEEPFQPNEEPEEEEDAALTSTLDQLAIGEVDGALEECSSSSESSGEDEEDECDADDEEMDDEKMTESDHDDDDEDNEAERECSEVDDSDMDKFIRDEYSLIEKSKDRLSALKKYQSKFQKAWKEEGLNFVAEDAPIVVLRKFTAWLLEPEPEKEKEKKRTRII
jgi:hypothetical protein